MTQRKTVGKKLQNPRVVPDPPRQFMSVPNNWLGKFVLWFVQLHMNKKRYVLNIRGRSPKKTKKERYWSLTRKESKRLGVYVIDKWEARLLEFDRQQEADLYENQRLMKEKGATLI